MYFSPIVSATHLLHTAYIDTARGASPEVSKPLNRAQEHIH